MLSLWQKKAVKRKEERRGKQSSTTEKRQPRNAKERKYAAIERLTRPERKETDLNEFIFFVA